MLSALFKSILAKNTLGMGKSRVDVLKLLPRLTDFLKKAIVIVFVLFVVVSLLGVQVIQLSFVSKVDLLDLLFKAWDLILHVTLFTEETIKVSFLLFILITNMHV